MSYDYQKERASVFTPDGADTLLQVADNINRLCGVSGCATIEKILHGVTGDSWQNLAVVDFLIETKRIREVPDPERPGRSHAIIVRF